MFWKLSNKLFIGHSPESFSSSLRLLPRLLKLLLSHRGSHTRSKWEATAIPVVGSIAHLFRLGRSLLMAFDSMTRGGFNRHVVRFDRLLTGLLLRRLRRLLSDHSGLVTGLIAHVSVFSWFWKATNDSVSRMGG